MNKLFLGALTLVVIIGLVFLVSREGQSLSTGCQFRPSPLLGKSVSEIESAALDYACTNFVSKGKAPHVRLTRTISPREYMKFFGATGAVCKEQQLTLVVFEGDFTQLNVLGATTVPAAAKYVALVFDLKIGAPMATIYSMTGEGFRKVLQDNSLPKKAIKGKVAKKIRPCQYGQNEPTVMPPN